MPVVGAKKGRVHDRKNPDFINFLCAFPKDQHQRLIMEADKAGITMRRILRMALKQFFSSLDALREDKNGY